MEITLKDSDIEELLAEVQRDLDSCLQKEKEKLAKAEDEDKKPDAPMDDAPSAPPADLAPAAEDKKEGDAPISADASAESVIKDPDDDSAMDLLGDEGEIDPDALEAEYAKLDLDKLKMHLMAVKNAIMKCLMNEKPEEQEAPQEDPLKQLAASSAPDAAPAAPDQMKAEDEMYKAELEKKEKELKEAQEKLAKMEDDLAKSQAALEKLGEKMLVPLRKSVKGVSEVEIPVADKTYTKEEVANILNKKIAAGKLEKSERDLVVGFYSGDVKFEQIKDLLK